MILKLVSEFGERILTIEDALSQGDAFEYCFLYDSEWDTLFTREREKSNGKAGGESTRSN